MDKKAVTTQVELERVDRRRHTERKRLQKYRREPGLHLASERLIVRNETS